ncbi:SagB/ThcOx family dehydrogenase [Streptomyces monashensis]|nr:SagB/ThcOx family dehydrogenase [Streptomyces monashensis]
MPRDEVIAFHQYTSSPTWMSALETGFDASQWPLSWRAISTKQFPGYRQVPLPEPLGLDDVSLAESLDRRRSERARTDDPLSLRELATLLIRSTGIRPQSDKPPGVSRYYPSAGARFPLEVYVLAPRVQSLDAGVYHFSVTHNALVAIPSPDRGQANEITTALYAWSGGPRAVFVFTAAIDRNMVKYGARGYRYALIEAGHASQNLALVASALGVACCPFGGFSESRLSRMLDLKADQELPVQTVVLP